MTQLASQSGDDSALGGSHQDAWTDDALTADVRVFQRAKGHRYSLDDLLTAVTAVDTAPLAGRHLDLGCGLGSVLLSVAWMLRARDVAHLGVEAQEVSFRLATANVARNLVGRRVTLRHGDLRELPADSTLLRAFDLVTGTPPYVPPGRSTPAPDTQKAYARIEYRGGIEAYLQAGAPLLTDDGAMVVCADARSPERVFDGARRVGLKVVARLDAIPREGSAALFSVFTLRHVGMEAGAEAGATASNVSAAVAGLPTDATGVPTRRFVARDAAGRRSPDYLDLRRRLGLPPSFDPHAEPTP